MDATLDKKLKEQPIMPYASRSDGRAVDELRSITLATGVNPYAEGSCEVSFGNTRVLCTATVEQETPKWMEKGKETGWITAEYGMLPRSTHQRQKREAASGKQGGRTQEIQRLIGRALRQAVDLKSISGLTIRLDCDVICADGGTRTASISGAWVALLQALENSVKKGILKEMPQLNHVAAVSAGRVNGNFCLDLNYEEDSSADFDLNVVCTGEGKIIEIQGTGEKGVIERAELDALIELAWGGISQIVEMQKEVFSNK